MAKGKGYKLTSSSVDGGPKVCAFFASDKGCRNGANCPFSHVAVGAPPPASSSSPRGSSTPSVASSSVVSSESDGGGTSDGEIDEGRAGAYASLVARMDAPPPASAGNPFLSAVVAPPAPAAAQPASASPENKKKKRKKSVNGKQGTTVAPGENIFDLGAVDTPAPTVAPPPAKRPKQQPQQQRQQQQAASTPPPPQTPPPAIDFRDLRLPVAPFSLPGATASTTTPSTATKTPRAAAPPPATTIPTRQRPLPTATPSHLRWKDAVLSTRSHANYATHYDFDRKARSSSPSSDGRAENGGGEDDGGWMSTRPYDHRRCSSNPAAIAIDCEMCETKDPITGRVDTKSLCRLSVVDADGPDGPVLLDTLVRPRWPVTDHRTWINGISADSLEGVEFTLEHARAFMDALCSDETVIVGHAVHNDLQALKLDHGCVVDTAMLYVHADVEEGESGTPSLRNLAHGVLGRDMPDVHDSVNDARVALACALHYVERGGKVDPVERVYRRSDGRGGGRESVGSAQQQQQHTAVLLVHRLPVNTLPEHISEMFLAYASIRPKVVPDIAFAGPHGKCHVEFASSQHAELAYATLVGEERADKTGKMQKRVGLKGGGYVCVRKMKKGK
ncbi:hypothetical protein ACHAW5_005464 [Stephanodiscus triporus]|uniref:C3H1-type domain-containing protein n=1 Tax=Stephanodiscus triporus TaxID=2934178 RepID=A0ABD3QGK3_9STRA